MNEKLVTEIVRMPFATFDYGKLIGDTNLHLVPEDGVMGSGLCASQIASPQDEAACLLGKVHPVFCWLVVTEINAYREQLFSSDDIVLTLKYGAPMTASMQYLKLGEEVHVTLWGYREHCQLWLDGMAKEFDFRMPSKVGFCGQYYLILTPKVRA